jgi:hypothetical protein
MTSPVLSTIGRTTEVDRATLISHHLYRTPALGLSAKSKSAIWAPLSLEISYNRPNSVGVFVASVMPQM